jgi:hypothetical protein
MVDRLKRKGKEVRRVKKKKWRERRKSRPFELKQPETGATGEPSGGLKITPKTLYLQPQNQKPPPPPALPTHINTTKTKIRNCLTFLPARYFLAFPPGRKKRRKRREKIVAE